MANRLQKLTLTSYVAERPYIPATPAHTLAIPTHHPATYGTVWVPVTVGDDGEVYFKPTYTYIPAKTTYTYIHYPGTPAVPGVPAQIQYTNVLGWNSGGRSKAYLVGDGDVAFRASRSPAGIVAGLARANLSNSPGEVTHGFFLQKQRIDIIENGTVVATLPTLPAEGHWYTIKRRAGRITYSVGPIDNEYLQYTSQQPSAGAVMLDVALYASGDYVVDPSITSVDPSGYAEGVLPALWGAAADGPYAPAAGRLPALTGSASGRVTHAASGVLPALWGIAADGPYAAAAGRLPALTGSGDGGFYQIALTAAQGAIPPLAGAAIGLTGGLGYAEGVLPALWGIAADGPYAPARGTLGALTGLATPRLDPPGHRRVQSVLTVAGRLKYTAPRRARIASTLRLGSSVAGHAALHKRVGSLLLLGSSVAGQYDSEARVVSVLRLGSSVRGSHTDYGLDGDLATEPLQYAVNRASGDVSQYSGFAFLQFVRVDNQLYGVLPDGLYLIGAPVEEGIPLRLDFGASALGTPATKFVSDLFLAGETDAGLIATAYTDGQRREYRVVARGPQMRSRWAKGVRGRIWGVSLEGHDATYFELDSIELVTQRANRIWAGG